MRILLLLLISIMLATTQRTYNPGVNFMMRNVLIDKFRNVIIPDIMQKFHTIKPGDIGHKEFLYEIRIYNMRGELQPLRGDQIQIVTSETDNSLFVRVTGFDMKFYTDAYGRALFISAHGDARIHVHITEFSFKVEPRIKADGDKK